jgi:uncharacterized repeat protein (TIGR03803 family)
MKSMGIRSIFVAAFVLLLAGRPSETNAGTLTNLHSFIGSDGYCPVGALVQGSDGNFYGTTAGGGANSLGNVFSISPSGTLTNLYSFSGPPNDGSHPHSSLVPGNDGNFYGTAYSGGASNAGIVFRISPSGSFTNLWSFTGGNDGAYPQAGLVQGNDGNFYGTTYSGGDSNAGTLFRISPSASFTNLWSFTGGSDGAKPWAGLLQGSDGNFYGTTYSGGDSNAGTVFRISPSASFTNLWSFTGGSDGANPEAGLAQGTDGDFYGTTARGATSNAGSVFRISPSGTLTTLYSFSGGSDGTAPWAGLLQGSDGNFYGTTAGGTGTVFRISPSGSFTNLYSFQGTDGSNPSAGLVQGIDGAFYGTTRFGGAASDGTVFRLIVPLSPPPNQISGIWLDGTNIVITIPSIAGEIYQLQSRESLVDGDWSNVADACVSNSIGGSLTLTDFGAASQAQRFYRFGITP